MNCFGSVGRGIGNWWNWEFGIQLMGTNVWIELVICRVIVMIIVLIVSGMVSVGIGRVD